MTPEQIAELVRQVVAQTSQPATPQAQSKPADFIESTLTYSHEQPQQPQPVSMNEMVGKKMNFAGQEVGTVSSATITPGETFTPVEDALAKQEMTAYPAEAFTPVEEVNSWPQDPTFQLTDMEIDLSMVLQHVLKKGQTKYTVENVFLQQLLRIALRVEKKVDTLEELITDEVLGYSDSLREERLVVEVKDNDKEETNRDTSEDNFTEEVDGEKWEHQKVRDVPEGGQGPPRSGSDGSKRRRNRRNNSNKRKPRRSR